MSWEDAWREGRTHWDAGGSSPALIELVERGDLPSGKALVPGAGAGYDVLTLASEDRDVTGIDLAPTAIRRFESLLDPIAEDAPWIRERARVIRGDFFELSSDVPFDLVWDYTFLCALEPSRRSEWVEHMHRLIRPGGLLLTLLFPLRPIKEDTTTPPFPIPEETIAPLLDGRFERLESRPVASHPGREGNERLVRWQRR